MGAASFDGLERLAALSRAHPDSPALSWLDEAASRIAREDRRAAASAARLDALLASGAFGKNAAGLGWTLRYARAKLEKEQIAIHDAWLRLGATRQVDTPREDPRDDLTPGQLAEIRRGARAGHPMAALIVSIDAMFDKLTAEERNEQELQGPFHGLFDVPDEVDHTLNEALHCTIHPFREMYGLELLRGAVPRLIELQKTGP